MRILVCGEKSGIPAWHGVLGDSILCSTGPDLEKTAAALAPEIVFLDADNVGDSVIPTLRAILPSARFVLWTRTASLDLALRAVAWGVSGVVLTTTSDQGIRECLDRLRAGELWLDQAFFENDDARNGFPDRPAFPGPPDKVLNFPVRGQSRLQRPSAEDPLNTYLAFLFHGQATAAKMG